MDDHDPETKLLEIVFVLKAFIQGYENIILALRMNEDLGIRQSAPFGFRDGDNFMVRESLLQTRINTFV